MTGAGTGAGAGAGTGPSLVPRTAGLALAGVANTWACVERGDRVVHNHTGDPRRLAVKKARNTSVMDTSRTHTLHFFIIHGLGYPFIRGCAVYSLQNNTHRYNATQTPHTPQIHNNTKTAGGGATTQSPRSPQQGTHLRRGVHSDLGRRHRASRRGRGKPNTDPAGGCGAHVEGRGGGATTRGARLICHRQACRTQRKRTRRDRAGPGRTAEGANNVGKPSPCTHRGPNPHTCTQRNGWKTHCTGTPTGPRWP